MKKTIFIFVSSILFTFSIAAQTKKDGTPDMRYNSNKQSSSTTYSEPSSTKTNTNTNTRPVYSGDTHTTSHGGTYRGEDNPQSHKGGTYENPKSNNNYGTHKKR